MRISERERSV